MSNDSPTKVCFEYGEKFNDMTYEYRVVNVPREFAEKFKAKISSGVTLSEAEWRGEGIQMSSGWEHAIWFPSNRTTILFRRPVGTNPATGVVDEVERSKIVAEFKKLYPTEDSTGH